MTLEETTIDGLEKFLPEFITEQRWYRAKARTLETVRIEDLVPITDIDSFVIFRIHYSDGDCDLYQLPVSVASGQNQCLRDALSRQDFHRALLDAIRSGAKFEGRAGGLIASRMTPLTREDGESFVSGAEQSNTSIIYGDRFILKLFRKLEAGVNPDLEIGTCLTERNFRHTPAVLGSIEYRPQNGTEPYTAAILQEFVPNRGDAWKYTLEALGGFFNRALAETPDAFTLKTHHPLELPETMPDAVRTLLGSYVADAELLARRTAEMHGALANANCGADFDPEPFTARDGEKLYRDMMSQADITFDLLRRKRQALTGSTAESADRVLEYEPELRQRFRPIATRRINAVRIRHHGDFHLGQVLYTGDDFMIIDFEGEPARPLAERRRKGLAIRDVAGMLRSFDYAASAALFGQVPGVSARPESTKAVEAWAAFWAAWVSAAYLNSYFRVAGKAAFAGHADDRRVLLDAFLLHKALYEVAYELNNRPNWLRIPLRGVLRLMP